MRYRPDVDGLRAVAVLPVVLFHAGVPGFAGGFTGVDVFFVISGYLITGLLRDELETGRFSFRSFYERRARRILPALFAVLAASCAAGWVWLPADELADLGKGVLAAALSCSNVLFWLQSDYFAAPSEFKPLLHTWSLAVEEQFYIVFPALLACLYSRRRQWMVAGLACLVALAFAAGIVATRRAPEAAFFLAPFRAWELGLGVLAALGAFPQPRGRLGADLLGAIGLACIAAGVVLLSPSDAFPGANALLPCLGALLVIVAGEGGEGRVSRLLATRGFVAVGLVSYSLYLWHWPVLVFAKIAIARPLENLETAGLLMLAAALSVLSWRYVEQPFRRRGVAPGPSVLRTAGFATALVASVGVFLQAGIGMGRPSEAVPAAVIGGRETYRDGNCFLARDQAFADWEGKGSCRIGRGGGPVVFLWGDSFAAHYIHGLSQPGPPTGFDIVQYTGYSCPPVPDADVAWAPNCRALNADADQAMARYHPRVVVLAARWERYWDHSVDLERVQKVVSSLKSRGMKVVIVGQGPSFGFSDPSRYFRQTGRDSAAVSGSLVRINAQLRTLEDYDAFFDPMAAECHDGTCRIRAAGRFLYWDGGHYSAAGSAAAGKALLDVIADVVAADARAARGLEVKTWK